MRQFRVFLNGKMYYRRPGEDGMYLTQDGVACDSTEPTLKNYPGAKVMFDIRTCDKDGQTIYDGDILEFDADEWGDPVYNKFLVSWCEHEGRWDTGGGSYAECAIWKKVIGNIHENPEMQCS